MKGRKNMSKNNTDVVIIELDRPRELRFGHKALKKLVALTGKSLEEIENTQMNNLEMLEQLVYCGLLNDAKKNGEELTLDDMEDLLDQAPSEAHIIEKVTQAFAAAFGAKPEDLAGNAPQEDKAPKDESTTSMSKNE
jgi:hypothetical protein